AISFDPRGVGESEPGAAPLTMPLLAADAVSVLEAIGERSAHVLGASMGGVVAQHVGIADPDRVRSLVLAATSPGGVKAVPADPRVTAALMGRGARTPADAYRIACTVLYAPQFQRTHKEFIEDQVRVRAQHPVRARVFSAQLHVLETAPDITADLRALRMPALVLHGTADAVTPIENAEALVRLIPGARRRWFSDCGHLFFHERPEETARVIDEFLRPLDQASG
ncbi:MAG TPA: alpha/beta fold hydrolase, partial [Candidatus Dormibacteraeota bacterium]|nr:alpha/beta fold hydrolase [Candidatus Dormibacteraeota bacterium]